MGVAWVFVMPILAIASGICFRIAMAFFGGRPLELGAITGVMAKSIPWLLFSGIVATASSSILGNIGLISKIYFPRKIVPISSILSTMLDFVISGTGIAIILLVIALAVPTEKPAVTISWLLLLVPFLIATLVVLGLGLGLFFGAANLFFRDVKYIVQVLLQYGIFFSLVYFSYYELGQYGWILLVNPVAPILEVIRSIVVQGVIDPTLLPWLGYSVIVTLLVAMGGCWVFDRAESLFAEYA